MDHETTSDEEVDTGDSSEELEESPPPRKLSRRWKILTACVVVLIVLAVIASFITLPYYAIIPGQAQDVAPLIGVPSRISYSHQGVVELVDVQIAQIRAIDWIYFKLNSQATIQPSDVILGPETPQQYNTEGVVDMATAQQAATVVALRQLGYHVTVKPAGALLYALQPGSPADQSLAVGDVIVAVDSHAVTSAAQLGPLVDTKKPGTTVAISRHSYGSGTVSTTSVRLGVWRLQGKGASATLDCTPVTEKTNLPIARLVVTPQGISLPSGSQKGGPVSCIGSLNTEDWFDIGRLPFPIDLSSEGIVGPSAGLAFTLGLMQKLDRYDLTGGHKIAATGTMSVSGQVGAIGGIEQKTFAVQASGASIFLVPPANYATAKKYAGSKLKVYAVSNITQALDILARYGGRVARR